MGDELDILVVGAGACGLCAAIAAHDAGLAVAVVEKMPRVGGNSALSTGSVPAAGTRFQREAGIADNAETYFRDLMAIAGETDDEDLVRHLTQISAESELATAYKHIGHSVQRLHAPVSRRGQDLVDDLVRAVEEREIPLAVGTSVAGLIVEDGKVLGARIDAGDGQIEEIRAKKTILAVNGFGANRDLVARFCPEIAGAQYFGAHGSAGEAILWGEELGADLQNMASYQGYAAVADPHGSLLSWTTIEKGGFLVGADGRRFGDESLGYSGYAKGVLEQGSHAFAVCDRKIFEIAMQEEEFAELHEIGGLKRAASFGELARQYGLDAEALEAEGAGFNAAARGEAEDRFGRRDFGLAPLEPDYFGCRVVPGLFHTQGGLRVDRKARVVRSDGSVVPNLYAGGGAATGISGRSGALGYASGNGLLTAVALGRLAALAAAEEIAGEGP